MKDFKQELDLENGVVRTTIDGHTFENKIEKAIVPDGYLEIRVTQSPALKMQMIGRATREKTRFLEILNNLNNSDYYDANLYDAKSYEKGWRDCESALFWEVNKDSVDTPRKILKEREALMAIKSYFLDSNEISKEDLNDIKDIVLEGLKRDD